MISKQTPINELVENHPYLVEMLLSHDVHCVGCSASSFESIEEGLLGHGISEEKVDEIIEEMNVEIKKQEGTVKKVDSLDLTLSSAAINKIKDFCTQKEKQALRVGVKAGGCSGYTYVFALEDTPQDNDLVIEKDGAKVYVSRDSCEMLEGSILDYNDGLTGAGFAITNPNAKATCGCGSSFN